MNAQDFLTNASIAYTLLMIAIILTAIFVFLTSKSSKKR